MNNNNNPIRPTCKAVLRPNERGARVHPRGCRVRYRVQPNGKIRKVSKATGQLKPEKQTVERRLIIIMGISFFVLK